MEVAVGTLKWGAQTLGRYGCHAETKDEDDEEYGDGVKDHMDVTPHRSSKAEVAPRQEGDGEGEENCYAGKSGWFSCYYLLVLCFTGKRTMSDSILVVEVQHAGQRMGDFYIPTFIYSGGRGLVLSELH